MRGLKLVIATLFWVPLLVQAELAWTVTSVPAHAHHGGGGHHGRPQTQLSINAEDAQLWLYTPDSQRKVIQASNGQVSLRPTGMNNYHLYLAERHEGQLHEVALYYRHMNGKPTGHSPVELVEMQKHEFEIIPSPLPREHRRWLSGKPVNFVVRFQGQPLAGVAVTMQTSNGSLLKAVSDKKGRVSFILPDDFSDVESGRRANLPAHMLLWAEHSQGGEQYRTSLTAPYSVNPTLHWQSQGMGWLLLGGGFVFGLGLVHFKNKNKEK